ncbi:hypothetical protein [Neobacillus mesonae]|uniref:hypothetical protein n=1 Tax=Neobacillus mesonae TaxID=1193713 RepID=UPI002E1A1036|nr:hypothetical protein [Neobacillus mesonae]
MLILKVSLLFLALVSQFIQFKFQGSSEGKDERGMRIQLETNSFLYGILYLGVIVLIVLNLLDFINGESLGDLLLYFVVTLSIFGAFYTNWKKRI